MSRRIFIVHLIQAEQLCQTLVRFKRSPVLHRRVLVRHRQPWDEPPESGRRREMKRANYIKRLR